MPFRPDVLEMIKGNKPEIEKNATNDAFDESIINQIQSVPLSNVENQAINEQNNHHHHLRNESRDEKKRIGSDQRQNQNKITKQN